MARVSTQKISCNVPLPLLKDARSRAEDNGTDLTQRVNAGLRLLALVEDLQGPGQSAAYQTVTFLGPDGKPVSAHVLF